MSLLGEIEWYAFGKDYALPLLATLIAIVVPSTFFYILPTRQNRRKTAMDFFNTFFGEEMRQTRLEAWNYLVTERKKLSPEEQTTRLRNYVTYATESSDKQDLTSETVGHYQRASRILHFFALVDTCLQEGTVDESMIRSFLGYYYLWWRDEVIDPLQKLRSSKSTDNLKTMPVWLKPFEAFNRVCGGAA